METKRPVRVHDRCANHTKLLLRQSLRWQRTTEEVEVEAATDCPVDDTIRA